jgi:hypothetical protein
LRCFFEENQKQFLTFVSENRKNKIIMAQITIQMQSQDRLNLLEELAVQLGGTIVQSTKNVISRTKAKEQDFATLSLSSLNKEWDSPEDAEWDNILEEMPSI